MTDLPTAIFLFTDIVGSTGMWDRDSDAMDRAMTAHDQILHDSITSHGGAIFKHTGDGICAAFHDAATALQAAVRAQQVQQSARHFVYSEEILNPPIRARPMGWEALEARVGQQPADFRGPILIEEEIEVDGLRQSGLEVRAVFQ